MVTQIQDQWARWVLHRRFGGDDQQRREALGYLGSVRDRILDRALPEPGETLLDVGAGDGLIGFGALQRVGRFGTVIFSDISEDLLDCCRQLATEAGVVDRCRFLNARAEDLHALPDQSVDIVTTRSVLIYVCAKQRAFDEFYRVLVPRGRISLFEPINRFFFPEPEGVLWGYDVRPVQDLAERVRRVFHHRQPPETSPMLDFDERDLVAFAERAGFRQIELDLQLVVAPGAIRGDRTRRWDTLLHTAPNPLAPTLAEAIAEALTSAEALVFAGHLRPLVEAGCSVSRSAVAYLRAVK